jgi:hypothetical protein
MGRKEVAMVNKMFSVIKTTELWVVLSSLKTGTFVDWAAAIIGVSPTTSVTTLGKLLKICDYIMTPDQAKGIVSTTDPDPDAGTYSNFFFKKNENGDILIGRIPRDEHDHWSEIYELGSSAVWTPGARLLVQNLCISKLGFIIPRLDEKQE